MKLNYRNFTPAVSDARWDGGYAGGPGVKLTKWADEVFGSEAPGPWLACYMLRRFGWPNAGSDDHKDLFSWMVTTPMPGLFLNITPYLGGSNLHFSVRFTRKVGNNLQADPDREIFFKRKEAAIRRWWALKGSKIYTLGTGKKEGDEDTVVKVYREEGEKVWALWKRTPRHTWNNSIPKRNSAGVSEFLWWLGTVIKEHHPEVKLPKMREGDQRLTMFQIQARAAIKATMRDLLRPTNVRDIYFTPFGDIERTPEAKARFTDQKSVPRWEGAGHAPSYWFSPERKRDEAKAKRQKKS